MTVILNFPEQGRAHTLVHNSLNTIPNQKRKRKGYCALSFKIHQNMNVARLQ